MTAIVEYSFVPNQKSTYIIILDTHKIINLIEGGFELDAGKYHVNFSGPNYTDSAFYKTTLYSGDKLAITGTSEHSCALAHPDCKPILEIPVKTKYSIKQFSSSPFPNGIVGKHYLTIDKIIEKAIEKPGGNYTNIDINDTVKIL